MALREHHPCGLDYLRLVTRLLQRARCTNPKGGLWEAADLQWWWRRDQHRDPTHQTFWLDHDIPIAAAVLTSWGKRWQCDLLSARHDLSEITEQVWGRGLAQIDALGSGPVEMVVRDDDLALLDLVSAAGFQATDERMVAMWMGAAERPARIPLPAEFTLTDRRDAAALPHHMIRRNGEQVADRLHECSLYQPALDLAVYALDGEVAAYGLVWADPLTGVGLVEPIRTEDEYQGLGLARHVLASGLDRLAAQGCSRLKVSYVVGNEASRRLYLGAGFQPGSGSRVYRRAL